MNKDVVLVIICNLILIVCVLVRVAFLTLLERKVLGYIHIRKGPNKVGVLGLLQPFGDAIKLFTKEQVSPYISNYIIYYISPVIRLFLSLLLWICIPFFSINLNFRLSILFFLRVSRLGVYRVILAGWSRNSNYAMLGRLRAIAQTISYEVRIVLILLCFLFLILSFNLIDLIKFQEYGWFVFLLFPLCLIWIVTRLAETNRSPFDFAEGESELVSGFNVEYRSGGFAMLFLAEYANILFIRIICSLLFLGGNFYEFTFFLKVSFFSFFWVWVRGTLPRYRYDKLMYLAWKRYLLISLNFLRVYYGFIVFCLVIYF